MFDYQNDKEIKPTEPFTIPSSESLPFIHVTFSNEKVEWFMGVEGSKLANFLHVTKNYVCAKMKTFKKVS